MAGVSVPRLWMPALVRPGAGEASAFPAYSEILRNHYRANMVFCYPLWDLAGKAMDIGPNGYHGAYSAGMTLGWPGIGDGHTAPYFDGAHEINIGAGAAAVGDALTAGEVTLQAWLRVPDSGVWADATVRNYARISADANNYLILQKSATANRMTYNYNATTHPQAILEDSPSSTAYRCVTLTINQASSRMWLWVDGKRYVTGLNNIYQWAGTPTLLLLGSNNGWQYWIGGIAYATMWSMVLPDPDISIAARRLEHIVFDGDSRTSAAVYPPAVLAALPARRLGHSNVATGGYTTAQMVAGAAASVDPLCRTTIPSTVVVWGGINDGIGGTDAATIYDRLRTYCQARKAAGWRVVCCTEIDGQSAALNAAGWHDTIYPGLNALLRADHAFADVLVDLAADARLRDATNTTYYNADKVHLTPAGYQVVGERVAAAI
jgi:lysophospholipase L1-like esterase